MLTRLDKFGRVIIPKNFLESLGIKSKSTLYISEKGKRIVIVLVQEKYLKYLSFGKLKTIC